MNKNIFWIISVFLISLNIVLLTNTHNYLIISIVLILSTSYIGFKFKKLFLENKKQNKSPNKEEQLSYDKVEIIILALALFFFVLSRLIPQYDTELLGMTVLFGLARMIRVSQVKKKKNS